MEDHSHYIRPVPPTFVTEYEERFRWPRVKGYAPDPDSLTTQKKSNQQQQQQRQQQPPTDGASSAWEMLKNSIEQLLKDPGNIISFSYSV